MNCAMFRMAGYSIGSPPTLSYAPECITYKVGNRVMGKVIGFAIALVLLANVSLANSPHHGHHHHAHRTHHSHHHPHH